MNIETCISLHNSKFKDGTDSFLFEFVDSQLPRVGEYIESANQLQK